MFLSKSYCLVSYAITHTEVYRLWKVVNPSRITTVAELSAEHLQREGRPLRIAVDEASWWYRNLTNDKVLKIREGM